MTDINRVRELAGKASHPAICVPVPSGPLLALLDRLERAEKALPGLLYALSGLLKHCTSVPALMEGPRIDAAFAAIRKADPAGWQEAIRDPDGPFLYDTNAPSGDAAE